MNEKCAVENEMDRIHWFDLCMLVLYHFAYHISFPKITVNGVCMKSKLIMSRLNNLILYSNSDLYDNIDICIQLSLCSSKKRDPTDSFGDENEEPSLGIN